MGEDRFEMSQRERDRLKVLHEAAKGLITQKLAGQQLRITERQVRRLLKKLRAEGDRGVVHGLRNRRSNRGIGADVESRAIAELSRPECHDFGPTFAAEHLSNVLQIRIGKDTVGKWMEAAGLRQRRKRKLSKVHQWRERRACFGELIQWDTSVHDWLEGRGERLYLIAMIDDATSRVLARFVQHDTAEENLRLLWTWLERYGRPLAFYTDKAAMFEVPSKRNDAADADPAMQPTQITRALSELGIERISAQSPQAKGRIERFFETAQDRLVKGLRLAGVCTTEAANQFLNETFLPEFEQRFTVVAANATDAHRPLTALHNVAASLSHVEARRVANDYTIQFNAVRYQIARSGIRDGLRGNQVRIEARLDGSLAVRFEGEYLEIAPCGSRQTAITRSDPAKEVRKDHNRGGRSAWMKNFSVSKRTSSSQN
jgi:transposase InsO family protein